MPQQQPNRMQVARLSVNLGYLREPHRMGAILYTRSNYINGVWHTVMLSADRRDVPILNAVAASIAVGSAPNISITGGGSLEIIVMQTVALLEQANDVPLSDQGAIQRTASNFQFIQV
jgi:hypothetical protein